MSTNSSVTLPYVAIGNGTYTAKRFGQIPTITYANTALAGHETTSVDSSLNITIGIQSGVSTLTQVGAAIAASYSTDGSFVAKDLVSLNYTSHGADTVTSCVAVPLAGGVTSSVKAKLSVGPLLLTAHTAGTAGNSITLKFTSGATKGSEVVSMATTNITVQIANSSVSNGDLVQYPGTQTETGSTYADVLTALLASGYAVTGVDASSNGKDLNVPAYVAPLAVAVHLAGGTTAAPATLTVQGITVTSITNDATQNGLTLTLWDGATAGSEVVAVDASGNVKVQCQLGTSTVTQIVTALEASTDFTTLYTASGSASSHPVSKYQIALAGAVGSQGYGFYVDNTVTALTSSFVYFPFLNTMQDLLIENKDASGNNTVIFSFDGINNHGILSATQSRQVLKLNKAGIYIKYGTGAPAYRCSAI